MSLFSNIGKNLFFSILKTGLNKKNIQVKDTISCNYLIDKINEIVIDGEKITNGVTPDLCIMLADKIKHQIDDFKVLHGCFFEISFKEKKAEIKIYYLSVSDEKKVFTYKQ